MCNINKKETKLYFQENDLAKYLSREIVLIL
jgi:hypothetical protein